MPSWVGGRRRRKGGWVGGGRRCVRAAGWEGFPLSHKADGADLCGCSQPQRGCSSPHPPPLPTPTSIEDSAAIVRKQPEAELQRSVHAHHQRSTAGPQTVAKFRLLKEQAGTSARYQGDARWKRRLKVAGR